MIGVIGHRGAAQVCTENTLASYRRGIDDGADVVEFDVHRSADGHLVLIHDGVVDRVAAGGRTRGVVAELTWAELREVDLGQGRRIPDLVAALEMITVGMHIEIKDPEAAAPAARLVRQRGLADRVEMTSFDLDSLRVVRQVAPELPLGVISAAPTPAALAAVRELSARSLALKIPHLEARLIAELQAEGVAVYGWAVRTAEELRIAVDAGVDMVTADDPGWCRAALAAGAY